MKKVFGLAAALLSVLLMLTPITECVSEDVGIELTGKMLSVQNFEDIYVRKTVEKGTCEELCTLTLYNITIYDQVVKFNGRLGRGDSGTASFLCCGDLYEGYTGQISDTDTIVADINTDSDDVNVLLFEVAYGVYGTNYTGSLSKDIQNVLRIYIRIKDTLYLFECELPEIFRHLQGKMYPFMSDSRGQLMWFLDFIEPEVRIVETLPEEYVFLIRKVKAADQTECSRGHRT